MKKILVLFCFVLNAYIVICQNNFTNEPQSFDQEDIELNSTINKLLKLNNNFEFEFRFWTKGSITNFKTVFILRETNCVWNAYYVRKNNEKNKWEEVNIPQNNLNLLWSRLVDNKILTLPTQDSIKYLMRTYLPDTTLIFDPNLKEVIYSTSVILDGFQYNYQLFNSNSMRSYSYHCPFQNLKKYPNIEQLYRAYVIVVLIRKYLGLDLEVC